MIKRIGSILLCVTLFICMLPISVSAASVPQNSIPTETLAKNLKSLNLFYGVSDTDFALQRKPSRAEAVVMLVRVLGKENAALQGDWQHPFTDVPSWAEKYVGYAYVNELTKGTSATRFGGNDLASGNMYLTFVLRALGYSEAEGDFTWNDPYALASSTGILPSGFDRTNFLREDIVMISYAALNAFIKGSQQTLAEKLIESGCFTEEVFAEHYSSGAVSLDIEPLAELKKMIQQYGSYDKKTLTYSFVCEKSENDDLYDFYERSHYLSYHTNSDTVTLHSDSYSFAKDDRTENTQNYTIYLTEPADSYLFEGYYKSTASKGSLCEITGEVYPHQWDRYHMNFLNWMQFEYTKRENIPFNDISAIFGLAIDQLLESVDNVMTEKGLTHNLRSFSFNAEPYKMVLLDEYAYTSDLDQAEIDRLSKYEMTVSDSSMPYAEAKTRYSERTFHNYFGDYIPPKSFEEAHNYLYEDNPDITNLYTFRALELSVRPATVKVLLNLLMATAEKELSYKSDNLEISFDTNEALVYHPDNIPFQSYVVRGKLNLVIKNDDLLEWTTNDHNAIANTYFYGQKNYSYNIYDLLQIPGADVYLTLNPGIYKSAHFRTNIRDIIVLDQ